MVKPVTAATGQVEVAGKEFHLPDWTSPPTGVVPKVVASEGTGPMTATGPVFSRQPSRLWPTRRWTSTTSPRISFG